MALCKVCNNDVEDLNKHMEDMKEDEAHKAAAEGGNEGSEEAGSEGGAMESGSSESEASGSEEGGSEDADESAS